MEPEEFASALIAELEALPESKTAPMRAVRRRHSKKLRSEGADYVLAVARAILDSGRHRWIAYELIRGHPAAFHSLDRTKLEALGQGMCTWSSVDGFARTLSGPAWREALISIDPKVWETERVALEEREGRLAMTVGVFAMPLLVLVLGIGIALSRRK